MDSKKIRDDMQKELLKEHGELVGGIQLCRLMGFASTQAFRQCLLRGQMPIQTFEILHRRGRFAYTRDVISWLSSLSKQPNKTSKAKSSLAIQNNI